MELALEDARESRDARILAEHKDTILAKPKEAESNDTMIQELMITIEELRSEILVFERKADEEAKNNGLFGKLQGAINDALYKQKFEDVQKRFILQQEEFNW